MVCWLHFLLTTIFLNGVQYIGWLLGVLVLVGSIFRLPVGILTDKYGGKWVMAAILFFSRCSDVLFITGQ